MASEVLEILRRKNNIVILLYAETQNPVGEMRAFFHKMLDADCTTPVIICREYREKNVEDLQIKVSMDIGTLLIDGFGDGVFIENLDEDDVISSDAINSVAFGILQASRVRITKTDYISCPGCGRTLFDLQKSIARVKEKTAHLTGLKIAIMGCIVNGPGEMADADYGYVGAGRGKVNLYRKKVCVEKNIPEEEAVERLLELIDKFEHKR